MSPTGTVFGDSIQAFRDARSRTSNQESSLESLRSALTTSKADLATVEDRVAALRSEATSKVELAEDAVDSGVESLVALKREELTATEAVMSVAESHASALRDFLDPHTPPEDDQEEAPADDGGSDSGE